MTQYNTVTALPSTPSQSVSRLIPQMTAIVESYFSPLNVLASGPTVSISNSTVVVHVFYYSPITTAALNVNTVNSLGEVLSSLMGAPVELRLVKLMYPYLEAGIMAQYLSKELSATKWDVMKRHLISTILPLKPGHAGTPGRTYLTGLRVDLNGRLMSEPSRTRMTNKTFSMGAFNRALPGGHTVLTEGKHTAVNDKGAYTVSVTLCHLVSSL